MSVSSLLNIWHTTIDRHEKKKSRQGNEGCNRLERLKTQSQPISSNIENMGPTRNRSLCITSAKKDLRFQVYHPEGVSFKLPGLSKTSKPGDSPNSSFHASFGEDKDLCPVSCLKCYETNAKEFRSTDINQHNKLFLSYISPHNPVTSSTLARWIKNMLQLAGIDTGIFSVHSIRGASTSSYFYIYIYIYTLRFTIRFTSYILSLQNCFVCQAKPATLIR